MTPQLLIAGHIVKDIEAGGWQAGGGALYAAAQAARLGVDTAVVTACEPDVDPESLIPAVQWHVKTLPHGIRFRNTYTKAGRTQEVLSSAAHLSWNDIPAQWRTAPRVFLAPVFHDLDPALPGLFVKEGASVGLGAQGWLRSLEEGRVAVRAVEAEPPWLRADTVFVSDEDVLEADDVHQWRRRVPAVILTRGRKGFTVWSQEGRTDMAAFPACEKDPTGAGDVFAAAYMVRFGETGDLQASLRFAAAAAAVSVEGAGIESVGDRSQIEARMRRAGVAA